MNGAITGYIDVAQVTLYVFWAFFAGLIFYLRREDKREGYPLISERSAHVVVQGLPEVPTPKTFLLPHGGTSKVPRAEAARTIKALPAERFLGAPLVPTGNPMVDGVGPAAYALRSEHPEMMYEEDLPRLAPLRVTPSFFLSPEDPDPRGMAVYAADRVRAGVVSDVWVDRSDYIVRYLEVTVEGAARTVLVPMTLLRLETDRRRIRVRAITAAQFALAPVTASPEQVSMREEDMIMAYFGSGHLYATRARAEPLL